MPVTDSVEREDASEEATLEDADVKSNAVRQWSVPSLSRFISEWRK